MDKPKTPAQRLAILLSQYRYRERGLPTYEELHALLMDMLIAERGGLPPIDQQVHVPGPFQ